MQYKIVHQAPNDSIDRDWFNELQFHPAFAALVGNPAPVVAGPSVVNVFELVDFITGQ